MNTSDDIARELLGAPYAGLDARSQRVIRQIAQRKHIAENTAQSLDEQLTLGERAADAVASFGGSWTFI
ncbi:MAG TPA: cyclic nucleotide-binding protein, partial [Telluria sp.]|nr:cyclic nucleotide-binding protein [Telluria sp.]